jgi:tetratricopeptide (TPR) repeat protein
MKFFTSTFTFTCFFSVLWASPKTPSIDMLLEGGRFAEARTMIDGAASPAQKWYLQSKVSFYYGDYTAAVAAIDRAIAADASRDEYKQFKQYYAALKEMQGEASEFQSAHFRLRARGADIILSRYALDCLEKAYIEIGAELGYYPDDKVLVEVYSRREEFSLGSTLTDEVLEKSGTVGICKFNRLMLLSPQATPLGFPWLDTLAHEYTHFLINRISRGQCPLWLHEGIARYFETRWRQKEPLFLTPDAENHLLGARANGSFVSLKKMHPSIVYLKDQDEMALAFAEVACAVGYMRRDFGPGVVAALLKNMGETGFESSFKKTFSESDGTFETKLHRYIAALPLKESQGVLADGVTFKKSSDEEYVGADARGLLRLGDRMRQAGRADAALVHYEKALATEAANPVILLKIARAQIAVGNAAAAGKRLEEAIEKNPHYVTPYRVLGELYYRQADYRAAADALRHAIAINPFDPDSHRLLARCYNAENDGKNAVYELKAAIVLDPSDTETKIILQRMAQ